MESKAFTSYFNNTKRNLPIENNLKHFHNTIDLQLHILGKVLTSNREDVYSKLVVG